MIEKELIQNKEDLEAFKSRFGPHTTPRTRLNYNTPFFPKSYPCLVVWHEWDNPNGPFEADAEFIYPEDLQ